MHYIDLFTITESLSRGLVAYIDPGSGSAIMSAIIGFIVAVGLAIKTYWYKLKRIFSSGKSSDATTTSNAKQNNEISNNS